jgi:hypothetical protein
MSKLSSEDVLRLLGGSPESISRDLAEFAEAAKILSSDHPRLIDEHPDEWVGIYDKSETMTAKDFPALITALARRGIPPSRAVVRFIDREEKNFLL